MKKYKHQSKTDPARVCCLILMDESHSLGTFWNIPPVFVRWIESEVPLGNQQEENMWNTKESVTGAQVHSPPRLSSLLLSQNILTTEAVDNPEYKAHGACYWRNDLVLLPDLQNTAVCWRQCGHHSLCHQHRGVSHSGSSAHSLTQNEKLASHGKYVHVILVHLYREWVYCSLHIVVQSLVQMQIWRSKAPKNKKEKVIIQIW